MTQDRTPRKCVDCATEPAARDDRDSALSGKQSEKGDGERSHEPFISGQLKDGDCGNGERSQSGERKKAAHCQPIPAGRMIAATRKPLITSRL